MTEPRDPLPRPADEEAAPPEAAVELAHSDAGEGLDLEAMAARVAEALERDDVEGVTALLDALRPPDRVDVFEVLPLEDQRRLIERIENDDAAEILEELSDEDAAEVATGISPEELAPILDLMEPDEAADVLLDLSPEQAEGVLFAMDDAAEAEVRTLLSYDDETAGGRMTRDFVALRADETVAQSIDRLREMAADQEASYYLYVVDAGERLVGIASIRQLVVASPGRTVAELMDGDVLHVAAEDDQELAARLMARYDLVALPVVDGEGRLVGVITHDDLVDVLEDEATEDMYRLVGLDEDERPVAPVWASVRSRLPWLAFNLVTQMAIVSVLKGFETTLDQVTALAVLLPLVTGQGGNVGSQTMTLVVRSLALGRIERRSVQRLLRKEVAVGVVNGLAVGAMASVVAVVVGGAALAPFIGGAIFLAMVANLAAGGLAGVAVPLTLNRLGVDPAVASAAFVTTVTDTFGALSFLGIFNLLT